MAHHTLRLRVRRITPEAEGILSYELVASDGGRLPPFEAGSHLDVHVPGGFLRQYSLCNDPEDTRHRYVIAVQRDAHGRGGSRAMHELVREGDVLTTSYPRCDFPLLYARSYVLVAGGIGITPLLSMAYVLRRQRVPWHLHYCTRSPERTAFRSRLASSFAGRVTFHHDQGDPSRGLDVKALLATRTGGTRLYCCGPAGLMRAVREAAILHQWPREKVHFEAFSAEATGAISDRADTEFQVVVRSTGATFPVPPGRTVLKVLRANGMRVPSDCEAGSCGTCLTRVLEGEPDHRDSFLPEPQRTTCRNMLVCVSRARSRKLVLDL